MAGRGERFHGRYRVPKPLITIRGKSMVEWAVETLDLPGNYIFILLKEHEDQFNIGKLLKEKYTRSTIITIDAVTEGPACTALLAKDLINNDHPLIITNCDQVMTWNSANFKSYIKSKDLDGCVVTYYSTTEKNSYALVNEQGVVSEVAEKKVISDYSLNGIHYWAKGSYFVSSAERMIHCNDRVNNEFYVAPTYNYLISEGKKITVFNLDVGQHHPVGTPEDLERFLLESL